MSIDVIEISNQTTFTGNLQKLRSCLETRNQVQYFLPIGESNVPLNPLLGRILELSFAGKIQCIACGRGTKKSFQQGYCFPCTQKLAQCDLCIVRPERCHFHLGTCREPEWAESHCMTPHIVYISNTSGLKVGITRETQIPTRWIDQGAIQALAVLRVKNRYQAGLIETELAQHFADKTDWRKMLKGETVKMDLDAKRKEVLALIKTNSAFTAVESVESKTQELQYPILELPSKINSLNLEKTPQFSGKLMGIKGQYLIFDCGVINIRNIAGYELTINI